MHGNFHSRHVPFLLDYQHGKRTQQIACQIKKLAGVESEGFQSLCHTLMQYRYPLPSSLAETAAQQIDRGEKASDMAALLLSNVAHLNATRTALRSPPCAGAKSASPPSRAKLSGAPLQRQHDGPSSLTMSVVMAPEVCIQRSSCSFPAGQTHIGEVHTLLFYCCTGRDCDYHCHPRPRL